MRVEGGIDFGRRDGAADANGVLQIFAGRQVALERRLVPEISELGVEFIAALARRCAAPEHLPFLGIEQSGDSADQGGLASAVLPRKQYAFAGAALETHAAQHMTIATPQVDAVNSQHGIDIGFGAPGRNRTGMALRPTDFKSVASTNSATGALNMWLLVRT